MKFKFIYPVLLLFAISCTNYGTKLEFNKGQLYYTKKVEEADAQKLGNFLVKTGFFDGNPKSVQLDKNMDTFLFKMVVKKEKQNDSNTVKLLKMFALQISQEVFEGKPVNAFICDDLFRTIRIIRYEGYGKYIKVGNGELFYTPAVDDQVAQKLADYLYKNKFYGEEGKTILLDKSGNVYRLKMVIKPEYFDNTAYFLLAQSFGKTLSQVVFDSNEVEIHFCDKNFNTLKIVK